MRWLLRAAGAACAALLALLAALHLFIVPRAGEARGWLEQQAQQALGAPLAIGALQASSSWLGAEVAAHDVCLSNANGSGCALHARRVAAALSLPALLRRRTLQLVIEEPVLALRRAADGRWTLDGLGSAQKNAGSSGSGAQAALDWVFSQPEWVVRHATLHVHDAGRADAAPLVVDVPQLVMRNDALGRHEVQLAARPRDAALGGAITLAARLHGAPLSLHAGRWQEWSGPLYLHMERLDGARALQRFLLPEGWHWRSGHGALRLWAQVKGGAAASATVDVALRDVNATLGAGLAPLLVPQMAARVHWQHEGSAHSLDVQRLRLDDTPLEGNTRVRWRTGAGGALHEAQVHAAQLDVGALAGIAARLPLPQRWRDALTTLDVHGHVREAQVDWHADRTLAGGRWRAQAHIERLATRAQPAAQGVGTPGVAGAEIAFEATHAGGQARIAIERGALEFPGVFEEPRIPLDELKAAVRWSAQVADGKPPQLDVQVPELSLANADAAGRFFGGWRTYTEEETAGGSPWPGVLALEGAFERANGARVHRYLPLAIPHEARRYVREAIRAGEAPGFQVRIKGDMRHLGKAAPPAGTEFLFTGQVQGVEMAYVPAFLQPKGQTAWPALQGLRGTLTFEHASMRAAAAAAEVQGHPNWRFTDIQAHIADLTAPHVQVQAAGSGQLAVALGIVRASPVAALTAHAMDGFKASGNAALALELAIPAMQPEGARLRGRVDLQNNTLRLAGAAPPLAQARGRVLFTERGFTLDGVRAQALGGEARAAGGMDGKKGVQVQVAGSASAEGIARMQSVWGPAAALAKHASGSLRYQLALGFSDSAAPSIHLESDTHGLALAAPAPFAKRADERWALRLDWQPAAAGGGQLDAQLGSQLALRAAVPPKGDVRGALALGTAAASAPALPARGVRVDANLAQLDAAAWDALLAPLAEGAQGKSGAENAFMPSQLALRAGEVRAGAHTLHDVRLDATRSGAVWRAETSARELAGSISYEPAQAQGAGRVTARLAHLHLDMPKSTAAQENAAASSGDEHHHLPALDVQVQDLRLNDRALGRLALNAGREAQHWRINAMELHAPEATLEASGQWSAARGQGTRLNLSLAMRDAGALLARFGMPGTVARGSGSIAGELRWDAAPWQPHWESMGGQLRLDVGAGQFLKVDPGIAKLLGVLSLQALPRRLTLDFRDIFSAGFAFDAITGDVHLIAGRAITRNLRMRGPQALAAMEGSADLARETQNLRVLIVPNVDAGAAALAAAAINPLAGLSAFLAQLVLQKPLAQAASRQFAIEGTWSEPRAAAIPLAPAFTQGAAAP